MPFLWLKEGGMTEPWNGSQASAIKRHLLTSQFTGKSRAHENSRVNKYILLMEIMVLEVTWQWAEVIIKDNNASTPQALLSGFKIPEN